MHRSKKNDPCIVTTLEGTPGTPTLSLARPLFFPFQSWKPGVIFPLEFTQLLQPQELQPYYEGPLFPSLQSLEPLAWYSLQDSRIQSVLQPWSSFAFKWPPAVLDLSKPERPWIVTSVLRNPGATSCSLQASNLQLDAYRNTKWTPFCGTPLWSVKTTSLPAMLQLFLLPRKNRGEKGRVKWNQLLCANLQDLAQLWGL